MKIALKSDSIWSSLVFRYFVANLTLRDFLKWPKQAFFGPVLAFYSIRALTNLTVVDSRSPRLRITKSG